MVTGRVTGVGERRQSLGKRGVRVRDRVAGTGTILASEWHTEEKPMELTWLPYLIAAVIIAVVAGFTFRRVPEDTNRGTRPPDPPR